MKYYDYSRGLKAPYSVQVIKSPKGKIVWVFAQPVSLPYILMLIFGVIVVAVFWKTVRLPTIFGVNLNFLLMLYLPNKLARFFSETEFDGKNAFGFIKDFLAYVKQFVLDNRPIVAFERVDEMEEFSFKR